MMKLAEATGLAPALLTLKACKAVLLAIVTGAV
jgi:hypothetical protein